MKRERKRDIARACLRAHVRVRIFFSNYFSLGWCSCIFIVDTTLLPLCFYVVGFKMCPIVAVKVRLNSTQFISPYLFLDFILIRVSLAYQLTSCEIRYHPISPLFSIFLIVFNKFFYMIVSQFLTFSLDMR